MDSSNLLWSQNVCTILTFLDPYHLSQQMAAYFGYAVAAMDINGDG